MKKTITHAQRKLQKRFNQWIRHAFRLIIQPSSRFFRHVFEFEHIRQALGLLVIAVVFAVAHLPTSIAATQTLIEENFAPIQTKVETIETEKSIRLPVETFSLTQGYRLFHPGIDLAAAKGSPVYPIMDGKVETVASWRWAFGNHVIIDHGSGWKSLYAHLSKIEVKEGEEVNKDSIIGLVGSTGWSTGPHLHLQVEQDGHWTNPRVFFESYFGQKLASTR